MKERTYTCSNCKWQGEYDDLAECEINKALLCPVCLDTIIHDESAKATREAIEYMARVGGPVAQKFMERNNL